MDIPLFFLVPAQMVLGIIVAFTFLLLTRLQKPDDLRFGFIATASGTVFVLDVPLFWSHFGVGTLLVGVQGVVAFVVGVQKLVRHFRSEEFVQH